MQPRYEPDTNPRAPVPVQWLVRPRQDRHGNSRSRGSDGARSRPVETRNGLPIRWYVYRGTGRDEHPVTSKWTIRTRAERADP
jgi:hypothetical protein